MANDEKLTEYDTQINILKQFQVDFDIERVCESVEHVRSEGMLYQDFPEQNVSLLEVLLKLALDLLCTPLIYTSNLHWWFITEVYDIIFHQVSLEEYPPVLADLYFKLSNEVLDNKFYDFYKVGSAMQSYKTCIYFILMEEGWFIERKEEFIMLFDKLRPLFSDPQDDLEEAWINSYTLLNNQTQQRTT